jgi:hypothetical protein
LLAHPATDRRGESLHGLIDFVVLLRACSKRSTIAWSSVVRTCNVPRRPCGQSIPKRSSE